MRAVAAWVLVLVGLVWLWGPFEIFSDGIIGYPAYCTNGQKILPVVLAMEHYGQSDYFKRMQEAERTCEISTLNRTTYKINTARGEVYYKNIDVGDIPVDKLINCAILSRTDWTCEYPGGGPKVQFIDGLQAIRKEDAGAKPQFFYMRRWQWWTARLISFFGYNSGLYDGHVRSPWLIPEQKIGV
jgi:hypothetical protein